MSDSFTPMRTLKTLFICIILTLGACSGSDSEDEAVVSTTTPPEFLTPEEFVEICPSVESLSSAADLPLTEIGARTDNLDFLGSDPESGATFCSYEAADSTILVVGLHSSSIDTALFLDAPPPGAKVDELPSGVVQIQFEGQAGCEIYDDRVSLVLATESDLADSCVVVAAAREVIQ